MIKEAQRAAMMVPNMQPLQPSATEHDDEISATRRLRRMKRRLLLGVTDPELASPPPTPSAAVRTLNKRHSLNVTPPLILYLPISPRSEDDEDISKDLSIRSDPGPYPHSLYRDTTSVSGVRKLRRIKRRLFLEQLTSDTNTTAVPPSVAIRSVSEPIPISPMKNAAFAGGGIVYDHQLQSTSALVANNGDTVSPLPSPSLSASRLRRIKRRLFLDHLECSDQEILKMYNDDDNLVVRKKASSSSLDRAGFMDVGNASPFMKIHSWSEKVEHDRALKEPPQLRVQVSYPPSFPTFPDLNKQRRLREREPHEKAFDGLSSKLETLSLKEAMKYNQKETKTAFMVTERMTSKAEPSNTAIYI